NVGTGTPVTVRELHAAVQRVSGREIPLTVAPARAGDVAGAYANVDRAAQVLGWRAASRRDEAVASALAWAQRHQQVPTGTSGPAARGKACWLSRCPGGPAPRRCRRSGRRAASPRPVHSSAAPRGWPADPSSHRSPDRNRRRRSCPDTLAWTGARRGDTRAHPRTYASAP